MERALHLIAVGVLTSLLGFFMTDALPGDAALAALGERATPEQVDALRADLGLDRPWLLRYADWLGHAVRGDLGHSTRTGEAVAPLVWQRFTISAYLMVLTQCIALAIAVPLALLAVSGAPRWVDRVISVISLTLLSTPTYVLALGLTLLFAIHLGWLPASGYVAPSQSLGGALSALLLPALSLAL
ncbi:MAG: ABC transporter permease, partial [Pseudomonadota bacterium]